MLNKTLLSIVLLTSLSVGEAMAVEVIRVNIHVKDGILTAMRNSTNTPVFDQRGGWAGNFSIPLQEAGEPAELWWGASWRMCRARCYEDVNGNLFDAPGPGLTERVSYEAFVEDAIGTFKHNNGSPNTQIVTYRIGSDPGDEYPAGTPPISAFVATLADVAAGPFGYKLVPLEFVPVE